MKNRLIALLMLLLGSLTGNPVPLVPDSMVHVADRILVVQGDLYYPPFEFINDRGEPDGFNVELFRALADMLGIKCNIEHQQLHFSVADTGTGMSPEALSLIFERFRQVSAENTRGHEGIGLGLTIAKAYTELLNGEISVDSSPGVGSIFHLRIPCLFAENIDQTTMNALSNTEKSGLRHFVVAEDDEINYQLLETILKIGFKDPVIHRAINGEEVLNLIQQHPETDAILMDLKMPVMDGYEATRRVKQSNPNITIIAITAYALAHDKDKAMSAGCDSYLSKPLLKGDLLRALDSLNITPDSF